MAQVLPFAALLQGLEVFHASGVVLGGEAIALLGPSNSGKTSLAMELCERGASFLADDVLTLEVADGRLRAHPGAPVAGVNRDAAEPSGEVLASDDREHIIRIQSASQPAPLGALFFIDRREEGPEPDSSPRPTPRCCSRPPSTSCSRRPIGCRDCWRSARWRPNSPSSGS